MLSNTPLFHIHPVTGEPGRCRAHIHECPFGSFEEHHETKEEARAFYEEYARRLTNPRESATFHFVTDEEESHLTEGDCGHLALALHKKTGWPMVVIGETTEDSHLEMVWEHMAVRAPDGRYLDAVGLSTEEDFKKTWRDSSAYLRKVGVIITEFPSEDWAKMQEDHRYYETSPLKVANKIVKSLQSLGLLENAG